MYNYIIIDYYELASSSCTLLPGEDGCMHACMLPDLLHVQEFELPIITQRKLCISSISRLKTKKILHASTIEEPRTKV